jgi:hypothetical protein
MPDKCVICKKDSHHKKNEHIKFRIGYIEGAGQLCLDCYGELYVRPKRDLEQRYPLGKR